MPSSHHAAVGLFWAARLSFLIYFGAGESAVADEQVAKLREVNAAIDGMMKYSQMIPLQFGVRVLGHSDISGSREINTRISHERATAVLTRIFGGPYNSDIFSVEGVGARRMGDVTQLNDADPSRLRRVSFEVDIDET